APEGQFSIDATNPVSRITELKQAVQAMHANGLRVDMDVVYNHVSNADSFSENQIVPGYFFRTDATGAYTNASGCGNDVASERPMVRKFIVDSVKYWASQYHLDGFRFDLMGLMDITTINEIRAALTALDPTILVIGEGWNMGTLPEDQRATQANIQSLPGVGAFNDEFRDGVKGSVFDDKSQGYVNGNPMAWPDLRASITGQTQSADPMGTYKWSTLNAGQSVNYVEAHDNMTLWDKLLVSAGGTVAQRTAMDQQAAAMVFLSEGLPFMQAGQEFLRSKDGDANSYQSPDSVNAIRWQQRALQAPTLAFYKGVIAIRNAHPVFRMDSSNDIKANFKFLKTRESVLAWKLSAGSTGDKWKQTIVAFNPKIASYKLTIPKGTWQLVVSGSTAGVKTIKTLKNVSSIVVPAMSSIVIHQ
ncbi:MAG: pullulanase, partial [Phenylobacterium zucineum]